MKEQIDIWLVGNTGLRNPNRIQDGFKVFAGSPFVGNLHGKDNEIGFMNLLNEKGIIQNEEGKDESGSHARKWRLMFAKNGFIYPQIKKKDKYLSKRGSKMLLLYAISKCMEVIVGRKVHDSWAFSFKNNTDFDELANLWNSVIKAILPVACAPLEEALKDGLKNKELAEKASNTVSGLLTSVQDMLQGQLRPFVGAANV